MTVAMILSAGCAHVRTAPRSYADPCRSLDPVVAGSSFVVVTHPRIGQRVRSPLVVVGCSRTFESNVLYQLNGRDGRVIAQGRTTGGGADGAGEFFVEIVYAIEEDEVATLEVRGSDPSGGEGFPPSRVVMPVVLSAAGSRVFASFE